MKINLWGLEISLTLPKSEKEVQMTGFYNLVPVARVGDWELCDQDLYRKNRNLTQVYRLPEHAILHAKCDVLTTRGKEGPRCMQCGQEMSYEEVCAMDDELFKHKRQVPHD